MAFSRTTRSVTTAILALTCPFSACDHPAEEDLWLPGLFGDGMVLQRDLPVSVWGRAGHPGTVSVSIDGREEVTSVAEDGSWKVSLPPLGPGGPHTLTVWSRDTVTYSDVLVGDVWIASGQSNMEWPLSRSRNSVDAANAADHPRLRIFTVARATSDEPLDDVESEGWQSVTPESVLPFSAVGYYFGRHLHDHLDVPIGLIESAWAGTRAESWTSEGTLRALPRLTDDLRRMREFAAEGDAASWIPSSLFNGMIAPLTPYAIRGAIWYQGESNTDSAHEYRSLFPAMIRDWRHHWGIGDFPFLFVQLANFGEPQVEPSGSGTWPELREAQTMALDLANTGQAVAIDIGEADDIHPRNKHDVGERLALAARHIAYGEELVFSGPSLAGMSVDGSTIRLRFEHVGGGLVARSGRLDGFAVAGEDRRFVWADAMIDGDEIVLRSDAVSAPTAVRYAWADNPLVSLFNAEGLPASPFRTDDWPTGATPSPAERR